MDRKPTEAEIEVSILKYLTSKGYWCRKNYDQANRVNGSYKKNQWQVKGMADLMVLDQRVIYLEVKTEQGEQSADQITFEKECQLHGIPYFVVRSGKQALAAILSVKTP